MVVVVARWQYLDPHIPKMLTRGLRGPSPPCGRHGTHIAIPAASCIPEDKLSSSRPRISQPHTPHNSTPWQLQANLGKAAARWKHLARNRQGTTH